MSGIDAGTMDTIERQRRLAVAMSPVPPTYGELAKRVWELENLRVLDLDLIHRAIKRIGALEDMGVPLGTPRVTPSLAEGIFVRLNGSPIETVVGVPEARLAELERVEKDFAAMREDRDAFQAKAFLLKSQSKTLAGELVSIFNALPGLSPYRSDYKTQAEQAVADIGKLHAKVAALESSGADRYDEALADCLRSLRQVLDGGKVECPFDADLVVALSEVARLRDDNRTLESESHTCPPGFRMVAVEEWERVKREAVDATELARETLKAWEPHLRGETVIAKARERLAARASAKGEAAPDNDRCVKCDGFGNLEQRFGGRVCVDCTGTGSEKVRREREASR